MKIEDIKARIQQAIQPQLDALDSLAERFMPGERIIGKHHPEYDTLGGRLNYIKRRLDRIMQTAGVRFIAVPPVLGLPGWIIYLLEVNCPSPVCDYNDRGLDHDLVMNDYKKHRKECNARGDQISLPAPQAL